MTCQPATISNDLDTLPRLPSCITAAPVETLEDIAFLSSASLNHLDLLMARDDVPVALIRTRLALQAAEASVKFSGRPERAGELRDAVHFLRPGDLRGPQERCICLGCAQWSDRSR